MNSGRAGANANDIVIARRTSVFYEIFVRGVHRARVLSVCVCVAHLSFTPRPTNITNNFAVKHGRQRRYNNAIIIVTIVIIVIMVLVRAVAVFPVRGFRTFRIITRGEPFRVIIVIIRNNRHNNIAPLARIKSLTAAPKMSLSLESRRVVSVSRRVGFRVGRPVGAVRRSGLSTGSGGVFGPVRTLPPPPPPQSLILSVFPVRRARAWFQDTNK